MPRKTLKNKSMKNKKMKGGVGASDHAIAVYGGIGAQAPKSDMNNAIASVQVGGKRKNRKHRGGAGLTEMMVPAVFLVANQLFKGSKGGKTQKRYPKK